MVKTTDSHAFRPDRRYRWVLLLLGASLSLSGLSHADDTEDAVDTIVVTGTRASEVLAEIPNTTTVIRLEEIEARNESSIADLLSGLPGIHTVQPSGQGGVARIFMRGGDQNLTMVLLDGVRVNDPNDTRGSAYDFSSVHMSDIERIEIVRGPQSAVYGSDALAGVINIISKEPSEEFGGAVFADTGSDDYYRGALDVSGLLGAAGSFSLRAAAKDDGEPVEGTTFNSDSISGRLTFGTNGNWDIRFFGSYSDSEGTAFPEDSGGSDLAVIRTPDNRTTEDLRFGVTGSVALADAWRLNYLATRYDHDSSYLSPGVAPGVRDGVPPNGGDAKLKRTDIAINAVVELDDDLKATFGVDYYDEDGTSDGFVEFAPEFVIPSGFQFDRRVTGLFGELHYVTAWGPTLQASVRVDDSDKEPSEITSKVGILHQFGNERTSIRANWGQGFSLPGFFSLASPLVGNPDLRPETSESFDIGLTHVSANRRVTTTFMLFHNEFKDLIDFESTVFRMINREPLKVDGVELQIDVSVSDHLSLRAQATHMDLEYENSDAPLRQRPDWRGGLAMRWMPAEKWTIDASLLRVGETFDSSIPTGDLFLDAYNRVDVTTTLAVSDDLEVLLSLDNLFDEEYAEAIGFPAAGIRGRLSVRYRF